MTTQPPCPDSFGDSSAPPPIQATKGTSNNGISAGEAYNIVSDTITGPNMRKSDNLFQLKVILVCLLIGGTLGAAAGALLSESGHILISALAAGLVVSFCATVLGLLGSGVYLMYYRAIRHLKGKHD